MSFYILILVLTGFIVLLSRNTQKSWIAPGTVYSAIWFFWFSFSFMLAPDFYRTYSGYTYIFLTVVASYLGTQLGYWHGLYMMRFNKTIPVYINEAGRFWIIFTTSLHKTGFTLA